MLVFAAITPHTPLLLEAVGKTERDALRATQKAFDTLREGILHTKPDTIVILSPHSALVSDAFAFNLSDHYEADFKEFGDLGTKRRFLPDVAFIDRAQRALRKTNNPITLVSAKKLDYGAGVPLTLLAPPKSAYHIVPITRTALDFKTHFQFGEALGDLIGSADRRIALVASSNLSHKLSSHAPGGFSPAGVEFDTVVRQALETGNSKQLLTLSPELVAKAEPCGFRVILMLLGALAHLSVTPRILAYENPFGVGYLTAQFELE